MTFLDRLQSSISQLWDFVPGLLGAAAVLIIGYLVAKFIQRLAARLLRRLHLNDALRRGGVDLDRPGAHFNPTRVIASMLFWFVMFTAMLVAANTLGLDSLGQVFSELVSYVPSVVAAIVIVILGIVLGDIVGGVILAGTSSLNGGPTLARAGKGGVIILAVFMSLQQLGVATDIVTTAFAIIFGAIALALALAFGLGNRDLAGEVTRAWYERYKAEREAIDKEVKEEEQAEGISDDEPMSPRAPVHTPVVIQKKNEPVNH